ncbi:hypothetical protein [Taibaiella soli]|uniref:Outer membrane protein beta-barrel domain-containing protein n=1 Tax=Taibaiella soli TaxID=1649169 RepID=A0A2W2BB00_9BACT|nr:hypothetical protein [Taibaiella soli]PZF73349.1 hypothetical protein DN068_08130 [Taibaiella soli]
MKKFYQTLLAIIPFCATAQQNSLSLDLFLKTNLMYANTEKINTADRYHFRSPITGGAAILYGVPVNDKVLFQAGIGYSSNKYALKFSLDTNSLHYKYKAGISIGTLKLPIRFQFLLTPHVLLVAGATFNYNRNWPSYTSKDYHYSTVDNYLYVSSVDQYKTSYLDEDFITFSGDLAVKYRLRSWLEFFVMGSYDFGKYPSVSAMNLITTRNGGHLYEGAINPKIFTFSIGGSWRLRQYERSGKPKTKNVTPYTPGEKGVNVDVLNGVLPQ